MENVNEVENYADDYDITNKMKNEVEEQYSKRNAV